MYEVIRDIKDSYNIKINPDLPFFCDTETCIEEGKSNGGLYGKIRLFQIYQEGWEKAILIDCFFVPLESVLELLKNQHIIFHNASYDLHTINLTTDKVWYPKKVDDTLYLSRLKYFKQQKFSFYDCLKYAGHEDTTIKTMDKKENQKSDWSGPLSTRQKMYAAVDVIYLQRLYEEVKEQKTNILYNLDIENLEYAVEYTRTGITTNQETVKELKKENTNKLEKILTILPINPRSSKQASEYLGTSSSKAEVLEDLVLKGDEKAKQIKDARKCFKALEYLEVYDRPIVRGFFNPCAAISGRFSCTGGDRFGYANLQQVPNKLHKCFQAPKGYTFVYKDYSGLELRMAVAYTGEPVMSGFMRNGEDMHTETAKFIFDVEEPEKLQRDVAKTFNFGLLYGAGIKTVQSTLRTNAGITISFTEVKERIYKWFQMYQGFNSWHNITKNQFNSYGYVDIETALGRKVRAYRYTDALNIPIQGSSVEVQKIGLGMLYNKYRNVPLVTTIHDSNTLLCKEEEAEDWGSRLDKCMVDAWYYVIGELADPNIPMPSGDVKISKIWDF